MAANDEIKKEIIKKMKAKQERVIIWYNDSEVHAVEAGYTLAIKDLMEVLKSIKPGQKKKR
jgi:ribosomal protein S24E